MILGMNVCSACNRRTTNALDDDDNDDDDDDGGVEDLLQLP